MISIKSKLISKFKSKNWIHSFTFIKYRITRSPSKPYMGAVYVFCIYWFYNEKPFKANNAMSKIQITYQLGKEKSGSF